MSMARPGQAGKGGPVSASDGADTEASGAADGTPAVVGAGATVGEVPPPLAGVVGAGLAALDELGLKVPSRCHFPVKLLNAPPTIVLVQSNVKTPELAL